MFQTFQKYLAYKKDHSELLYYILRQLTMDQLAYMRGLHNHSQVQFLCNLFICGQQKTIFLDMSMIYGIIFDVFINSYLFWIWVEKSFIEIFGGIIWLNKKYWKL